MTSFLTIATDRRSLRRAVRIECQVVLERDFRLVGVRTLDLSVDGMLVQCEAPVLTGEVVIFSFQAPGTCTWIDGEGLVARVVHGRRPLDPSLSVGIAFAGLDELAKETLRRSLRGCPPPLPSRAPRIDWAATARQISLS
jgi:hypothetical protein